eukprot:5101674-Prymnesium_polylepis.2
MHRAQSLVGRPRTCHARTAHADDARQMHDHMPKVQRTPNAYPTHACRTPRRYAAFWNRPGRASTPRKSLLAVHIRWGDKGIEANLLPAATYIAAVERLVRVHGLRAPTVFLDSEDANAIEVCVGSPSRRFCG